MDSQDSTMSQSTNEFLESQSTNEEISLSSENEEQEMEFESLPPSDSARNVSELLESATSNESCTLTLNKIITAKNLARRLRDIKSKGGDPDLEHKILKHHFEQIFKRTTSKKA